MELRLCFTTVTTEDTRQHNTEVMNIATHGADVPECILHFHIPSSEQLLCQLVSMS